MPSSIPKSQCITKSCMHSLPRQYSPHAQAFDAAHHVVYGECSGIAIANPPLPCLHDMVQGVRAGSELTILFNLQSHGTSCPSQQYGRIRSSSRVRSNSQTCPLDVVPRDMSHNVFTSRDPRQDGWQGLTSTCSRFRKPVVHQPFLVHYYAATDMPKHNLQN